jgi:hypothetical protein
MNFTNRQSQESPLAETTCVFDLFIDIPHPAASLINERAQIIEPPGNSPHPEVLELFDSSSISRIAMFSFPDYDAEKDSTAGESVYYAMRLLCHSIALTHILVSAVAAHFRRRWRRGTRNTQSS